MTAHSSPRAKAKGDGSWIVHDNDDGNISWAGDSVPSESDGEEQGHHRQSTTSSPKIGRERSQQSSQSGLSSSVPEFIMPSIDNPNRVFPRRRNLNSNSPNLRQQKSRKVNGYGLAPPQQDVDARQIGQYLLRLMGNVIDWLLDIVGGTLNTLKKPITWGLSLYALIVLSMVLRNYVTSSIESALWPVCQIPGISFLNLPFCHSSSGGYATISSDATPEFNSLMEVQGHFEGILEDSHNGLNLPYDMRKSESSIRDLRTVIRYAEIPSRNELLHEFDGFIETARIASGDLQKFNSHVGRGVDIVLGTAHWTQRVLDDIGRKQLDATQAGIIPRLISSILAAPFRSAELTEVRLLDQYIQHTQIIKGEIEKLLDEAQALLRVLDNLESRLDVMYEISFRDRLQAQISRDEILGEIWTMLGGNRAKLGKYNRQIGLLRDVGNYRKRAMSHLIATVTKLEQMKEELEQLQERVGSAEVARDIGKNVPLSVHIASIRMGVERLEAGRQKAKELESQHTRMMLDRSEGVSADSKEVKFLIDG